MNDDKYEKRLYYVLVVSGFFNIFCFLSDMSSIVNLVTGILDIITAYLYYWYCLKNFPFSNRYKSLF